MKIDMYTKTILTVIAICLLTLSYRLVSPVPEANAQGTVSCTGTLTANAFGGITEIIGGYNVRINCG